jgi:hypothetical protein
MKRKIPGCNNFLYTDIEKYFLLRPGIALTCFSTLVAFGRSLVISGAPLWKVPALFLHNKFYFVQRQPVFRHPLISL